MKCTSRAGSGLSARSDTQPPQQQRGLFLVDLVGQAGRSRRAGPAPPGPALSAREPRMRQGGDGSAVTRCHWSVAASVAPTTPELTTASSRPFALRGHVPFVGCKPVAIVCPGWTIPASCHPWPQGCLPQRSSGVCTTSHRKRGACVQPEGLAVGRQLDLRPAA